MAERWFDDARFPALIGRGAMRMLAYIGAGGRTEDTAATPQPERAQTQRKLDCIVDAIRAGLPEDQREGWDVTLARENGPTEGASYTSGSRVVRIAEDDVNHPTGVSAAAHVIAHEMAHNIAQHPNRITSARVVNAMGEERARKALAQATASNIEHTLTHASGAKVHDDRSMVRAMMRAMEHEADTGALHLLNQAGLPLDGGAKFFQHHIDEKNARASEAPSNSVSRALKDWREQHQERAGGSTHPPDEVRQTRLEAQAQALRSERGNTPALNAARLEACEEPPRKRGMVAALGHWLSRGRGTASATQGEKTHSEHRPDAERQGRTSLGAQPPPTLGRPAIAHARAQAHANDHGHGHAPVRAERELDFGR